MQSIQFLMEHLYPLYEVPIRCFQTNQCLYPSSSKFQDADPLILDDELLQALMKRWDGAPYIEVEKSQILYGVCTGPNGITCIVGPVSLTPLSSMELHSYKSEHGLLNFTSFSIVLGSPVRIASLLALFHKEMNNTMIEASSIVERFYSSNTEEKLTDKDIFSYSFEHIKTDFEPLSYKTEKKILDAIKNGDLDTIRNSLNSDYYDHVGLLSKESYKQMEYTAVVGISLFTRAAIEGGVERQDAYRISDLYIQKIAACNSVMDLQKLSLDAKIDLCTRVQSAKNKRYSRKYVDQCKRYVTSNLHRKISLDKIAEYVGINKCYLTNQFTKEEGTSLKFFINHERVKVAQEMLKYSGESISTISNYLCYNSQSHFGAIFKKVTGMTPAAYREKERKY